MRFLDRPPRERDDHSAVRKASFGAVAFGATASGATALGTLALGTLAVGAVALGALAIGRLAVGKARVRSLEIGDMKVGKLTIGSGDANGSGKPAIARIWRGRTRRAVADEYEAYNYEAGVKPLIEKALGVQCFREDREAETEFVTISYWESREAMSRFTGGDPDRIHHLPRDKEFLIEMPEKVEIYEVTRSHGNVG
jgi:heme-degrading monooxygenase HmoA